MSCVQLIWCLKYRKLEVISQYYVRTKICTSKSKTKFESTRNTVDTQTLISQFISMLKYFIYLFDWLIVCLFVFFN